MATPVFLSGESHGQRNLAGYGPWGRKELNTDERLTLSPNKSSKHVGRAVLAPLCRIEENENILKGSKEERKKKKKKIQKKKKHIVRRQ